MESDAKRKMMACLGGVVVLTMLIAAALPHLELKPGVLLPALDHGVAGPLPERELSGMTISISAFWKAILVISLLVGLIYNGYRLLRNANWNWRDVVKSLVYIGLPIIIAAGILSILSGVSFPSEYVAEELPPPVVVQSGPPLGPLPLGLIWLAGLCLAATLVGLGLWFIFRPASHLNTDRLTLQAEWALQTLKSGGDLKNVIVRCYWQMEQVLKEEQGIEKETAMTVREFEHLLEARGMPQLPVHQLTQLFEMVRYGRRATSAADEHQAIEAFTAILQYSQANRPPLIT